MRPFSFPTAALLLAGAMLLGACGNGGPNHLVVTPTSLDFGQVLRGEAAEKTLRLENRGGRVVYVSDTVFNCSCFQIRPFHRALRPDEVRLLTITFLSGAVPPGRLRGKRLDILSDDPLVPRLEVPLDGEGVQPCTILPPQVDLGALSTPASRDPRLVSVRPGPGLDLALLDWNVRPPGRLEVTAEDADAGVDFTIRLHDGAAAEGPVRATLSIRVQIQGAGFPPRALDYTVPIVGS